MIKQNTKECAYDAFEQELHVGDKVIVVVSQNGCRYCLYKGTVLGWSNKRVEIRVEEGAINTEMQDIYPDSWWSKVNTSGKYNSDKIYKI